MTKKNEPQIYLNKISENWIIDRIKKEWIRNNKYISTKYIKTSNIIWIIAPWNWNAINKKYLENRKVICSIYHIDESKFDELEKKEFYSRDKFVDEYHTISQKTMHQLEKLTSKKITVIPFWVNTEIFFHISDKESLRKKYKLSNNSYLIGSFQRDSEGYDLTKPKLSKGPDRFIEIVKNFNKDNIHVVITGRRRNYLINELKKNDINFSYFEMINFEELNELYNCLNMYIVASRYEGGPQAIFECGITKTPIISTNVGVASEILSPESIFNMDNYLDARENTSVAYQNSAMHIMEKSYPRFIEMFRALNES
tara:strand:+ start:1752 stop:2687 length:936 start_codon:yes stop_codon:yes gene_type:complete